MSMLGFEHFKFNDLMFICTFLITLSCTKICTSKIFSKQYVFISNEIFTPSSNIRGFSSRQPGLSVVLCHQLWRCVL